MFRKADSSVYETFLDMIENVFPNLAGYSFGLLFREKIKKSRGRMVFAEICLPSKLMSYFARNDQGQPYDFILIADEMVWAVASETDRIRIMRHELRHVTVVDDKPRLVGHDFEDFYAEVELNNDDPAWGQKLYEVAQAGYDQVKAKGNDPRLDRKDAEDIAPVTKDPQRQVPIESAIKAKAPAEEKDTKKALDTFKGNVASDVVKFMEDSKKAQDKADSELAKNRGAKTPITMKLDEMAKRKGLLPKNA